MDNQILILLISLLLSSLPQLSISSPHTLLTSSSLSVSDVLISPNRVFSAGFHKVGENAYCFSIWFTEPTFDGNLTVVWTANRDQPINSHRSKLSLLKSGNLVLTDAAQFSVWSTNTNSLSPLQLQLQNTGNLILGNQNGSIWDSFHSPTDTLLPNQLITRHSKLVSSRSQNNFSSGFYSLFFDEDHIIRLLFDGPYTSSVYWPDPWLNSWEVGRTLYNDSQIAAFNSSGYFRSSDGFQFKASDYGVVVWRRLKMDADGNVRLYSLDEGKNIWSVSWQAMSQACQIPGACGANAICTYDLPGDNAGRRCTCLPGYKAITLTDWSLGCEPEFNLSCNAAESGFIKIPHTEFYGYDLNFDSLENYTLERCKEACLQSCNCSGFNFPFRPKSGFYSCYPKSSLLNGSRSPGFGAPFYVRLPKASLTYYANQKQEIGLHCPTIAQNLLLDKGYKKPKENGPLQFMVLFASAFGGIEIICICFVWGWLYKTRKSSSENAQGCLQITSRFRRFTYDELKKATRKFTEEIGRGGGGVVYKGILVDGRVAAIKRLNEANQGEAEFLAEVSTIGRVNHMNLIEIWGYCAEGNHRLLVYEYMERGSLAENLVSGTIDWEKRFDIAVGAAKGLAYLHEECLEWVLHCDVKPQNILLDSNFQPKVADFGLSKLVNRGAGGMNSSFSRVRGTRGYIAPEWISNLPITSKVDVYSYGVVVMEMVTGKSPMTADVEVSRSAIGMEQRGLVKWVREKMNGNIIENELWLEAIIDPVMKGKCDLRKMGILVQVALECLEEDKDARPTMSQVLEKLLPHEKG